MMPLPSPMVSIFKFTVGFALVAALYTGFTFEYWAVGFILLLVASSVAALGGYSFASLAPSQTLDLSPTSEKFNIVIAVVAILGILAMFYDRTALRGIDYVNLGVAAARAEFNRAGERGGFISILGNLFSAAVYLPLINLIFDWERWGWQRNIVMILVILGILGLTYITGGRTALLIAIAVAAAAMLGRGSLGLSKLPSFLSTTRLVAGISGVAVLFGGIFALRAEAFGAANASDYLSQLCVHLAQPAIEILSQCQTISVDTGVNSVDELANFTTAVLLYAFHVAWIGEAIIASVNPGVSTAFTGLQDMFLSRFGYQISATDYDGYFIPAGASLVYDYGYIAMALAFALLGYLLGLSRRSMARGKRFFGRIAFCYCAAGLFIACLISPANLPVLILSIMAITFVMSACAFAALLGFDIVSLKTSSQYKTAR